MKFSLKRLTAALLLVCLLASMIVPATFAENDPAGAITYDFQIYENPDFASGFTYQAPASNFNGHRTYNGTISIEKWFQDNYPQTINWGMETSNAYNGTMKDFEFRGKADQGVRLFTYEAGQYISVRIHIPAEGNYAVNLNAGNVASISDIYMFKATTDYATQKTAPAAISAAMTATANQLADNLSLAAEGSADLGEKVFESGDYIVVIKAEATHSNGIVLRRLTLTPVAAEPEQTTTAAVITGQDISYNFNLVTGYAEHFGSNDISKLNKVEDKLAELYPDTVNWNYEDSSNGSDQIELRVAQGLRLKGTAGDWAAFRLSGITAGFYEFALTSAGASGMNFADIYLVKAAEGLDIAGSMVAKNLVTSATVKTGGTYTSAAPVELEDGEYILIIKHTATNTASYLCLTSLSLTAVAEPIETTAPSETTAPETTVVTEPTEPFVPTVDKNGIFDFNVITTYPELCGGLNTRHYDKKAVDKNTQAIKDENGKDMKVLQYLESLYKKEYMDWVLEASSFQNGEGLENIELRVAQGLRIYGTAGDYVAFRLSVPVADTYNLLLTSGGSNLMNVYLAEATDGMDIAGAMTEENLLVADVKAASKAAIKQEVKLEAKDYILIVKHMTGDGTTYWTLSQLALEKWTPKTAKPAVDKKVYDFDLVNMDGRFIKKTLTNRLEEGGSVRVSAQINEMYQADQIQWIYEGASETFPVKEFSFRENFFRLKASVNMKKLTDPWIAFRLDTPGTGTYDVRLISKDKSQVCVNIYLIPATSTLTLTNDQIKAGMNEENLLVKNAQIDDAGTFYLGDYTFGVDDEYVMVVDFIKGGTMFLSQIEMTKDGLVADGTVKHGVTYSGIIYDLDLADQMDGIYSDSSVYMPDVIDDMNARWASGELNWKFYNASEGLSGTTVATMGKPTTSLRFYRATGMRVYGSPDAWMALKIKSPGSGDFTITLNHATCANSGTMALYVLPADTPIDQLWAATDPENRVGKVVLTNETGDTAIEDGKTSFVGYWNFEAGKEYILLLECYEASIFNAKRSYMQLSQIVMQKGIIQQESVEDEKKVTAMTVADDALPVADAGTYGAIMEVNGHDWYFLPVEGKYMLIYDLDTGALVDKVYDGVSRGGDVVVTKDNKVVVAGVARPFVYDPYTGEGYWLSDVRATPGLEDTQAINAMFVDEDNTLWLGIHYGGFLASYNFETKEYTNYGNPYGWQNRVTGVMRRGDYIYACIHGDTVNKIFKWDINTQKVVADYDVSQFMGTASYIHSLNFLGDGDYLVAGGSNLTAAIVLDPETFEPVDLNMYAIPNLCVTEEIEGKQYMVLQGYGLYEYDIATKTVSKVPGFGTSGLGFRTGAQKSYGKTLVTINGDPCLFTYTSDGGHPRLFNMNTKEYSGWDNLVVHGGGGSPLRTFLGWGEGSNRFSFGGFNTDLCAVYNTELGGIEFYYKTGGQTDSHVWYEGKLYAGNYSSTTLNEIYPDETNTSLPATNEFIQRWMLNHEETGQKRIHIMEAGDGYVFAGTTPDSNLNGGGICTYDTRTGRWKFVRNVIQDQSVNGLQYHDGLLYGTTTLAGGSGSSAVEGTSAVVFVYDYITHETVAVLDPRDYISGLAGPVAHVDGVTADPNVEENGRFWCIVSETLFCFTYDKEARTFNVQEVISFGKTTYADGGTNNWWPKSVLFDTERGYIYASFQTKGGMQRLELADWNAPIGSIKVKNNERFMADIPVSNFMIIGDDGNFYYSVDTDIKMFPLNLTDEDWAIAQQVDDLITAIGDEITVESEVAIKTARSAYENLSWRYKSLIQKLEVLQEAESDILERKIDTLEGVTMTADDYPAMQALMDEYKGLNARQQRYVKNYDQLKTAYNAASDLNDQRIAAAMQKKIDALKDKFPLTLDNEPEVLEIRAEFNSLTGKQGMLVDTTILEDAEAQIAELRREFVKHVEELIQKIPAQITLDAEEVITAAREAADKLYVNERKEVSYAKLTSAEGKLRTLRNAKVAADEVDALIDAIGIVTLGDKDRIAEAREAYDALNGTALTFLQNGKKLETAEKLLKILQTWGIPAIVVADAAIIFAVIWFVPSLRSKVFKKKKEESIEVEN